MRFGQEGNVIGFVQSSWQPTPADICSLLTTQTYLHQGTHTQIHTHARVCEEKSLSALDAHTVTHVGSFCGDEEFSVCQLPLLLHVH